MPKVKSTAQHKRDGTFREDRQGHRLDDKFAPGLPANILELDELGETVRELVISGAPEGVLTERDGVMLDAMSMIFSSWVQAHHNAEDYSSTCSSICTHRI